MKNPWEEIYKKGKLLEREPHNELAQITNFFKTKKVKRILDLGCGRGRHILYLAGLGFDVYGLDLSPHGLIYAINSLAEKGLSAHFSLHDMVTLPYDDAFFDAVISIQVIHHNKLEGIRHTISEITRVLRNRGIIWITIPISKNEPSKKQKEIESDTFLPLDGQEKGLLHHYFKEDEIPSLFPSFSVIDLHVDQTNHFSFLAEKEMK